VLVAGNKSSLPEGMQQAQTCVLGDPVSLSIMGKSAEEGKKHMLLKVAAIIIFLHGLVHLIGVVTFWKLGLHDQYSTKVLGGALDIGERGTYVLGFAWLVATVACAVAAYGMFADLEWWRTGLAGATVFSLVLTVLGWKDSIVGTVFNVIVLVALLVG
jgi:hypothetical protein